MKTTNIKAILGVALLSGGLASCSVEQQELPAEELYTRQFIKEFGLFDKNQTWNVVEQKSLTFDVTAPTHVKVYEQQGGEYRLAADYENVTSGQTITFDGVKGDDSGFLVSLDGNFVSAKNGQTVSLKQNASVLRTSVIPEGNDDVILSNDYTNIPVQTGEDNVLTTLAKNDGVSYKESHAAIMRTDLFVTKVQSVKSTFYPIYWDSNVKHTVGMFWLDKNANYKEVDIYTDHEGDEVQYFDASSSTWVNAGFDKQSTDLGEGKQWNYKAGINAKGFTINLAENLVYGIYVKINGKKYYSQASKNEGNKSYFAYSMERGEGGTDVMTYLYFDDPTTDDKDFNDLIICTKELLTPITEASVGWTVACEDLGGTYDFDFNDLVFRVYHTSGYNFADIVPVAAGGTLPAWVHFRDQTFDDDLTGEWHSLFGTTSGTYSSSQMINTFNTNEKVSETIRLMNTGTNWTMSTFAQNVKEAGGISIRVKQQNGEITNIYGPNPSGDVPNAPQLLVLPLNWQWPTELVDIRKVYTGGTLNGNTSPSFVDWAKDVTKNTEWTKVHTEETKYIEVMTERNPDNPTIVDLGTTANE